MKNYLNLAVSISVIGAGVLAAPAFAQSVPASESAQVSQVSQIADDAVAQNVTSVSQLSDVRPTDWAFTSLQSLVERYGCIAGYPDRTYRGSKSLSRYEFAAGLNACLDKVNEIISSGLADKVSKEDLSTLQKLQEEFAAELSTLRGRVGTLEGKVSKLEAQQFSTTTKLTGEAIVAVTGSSSGSPGVTATNTFVTSRVRLNLNTSFTGSDLLLTRLEVGNGSGTVNGATGILTAGGPLGNSNIGFDTFGQDYAGAPSTFTLGKLRYDFPIGKDLKVSLGPVMHAYDHIDTNSFANNEAVDFSSTFFINNPLHILVNGQTGGAGAFVDWNPGQGAFSLRALYLAGNGASPGRVAGNLGTTNAGLFGDPYQGTVEAEFAPKDKDGVRGPFALKLQYTSGSIDNIGVNAGGANVEWAINKGFAIFGRYGFGTLDVRPISTKADVSTWQAGIAFPNLFKEGALAAIGFGQPLITNQLFGLSPNNASQSNLEVFYNFPVSDNIRITPDLQLIFNPNNDSANSTIFVGTLRTVFTF